MKFLVLLILALLSLASANLAGGRDPKLERCEQKCPKEGPLDCGYVKGKPMYLRNKCVRDCIEAVNDCDDNLLD